MKKWWSTAAVLAVLAALGTYVWLFESKPKYPGMTDDALFKVKPENVVALRLEQLDKGTAVALEKRGGNWKITVPAELDADADAVDMVLQQLATPRVDRRLGPATSLAEYGLDRPSFRATVTPKRGKARTLVAGRKNPTGTAYYAMAEGANDVAMIPSWVVENSRKGTSDLRSRTPAPFEPDKVTRLVMRRAEGGTLSFERAEGDSWKMTRPTAAEADRYSVNGILADLRALRGVEIIDEVGAKAKYRLDNPLVSYELSEGTGKDAKTLRVDVSRPIKRVEEMFATSSRLPYVFKIAGVGLLNNSTRPAEEYRERLLLSLNREDLREATVTWRGKTVRMTRGWGDRFSIAEPRGARIDEAMNDALFELIYVRAEKFVDDSPANPARWGLDPAACEVTLKGRRDRAAFGHRYRLGNRLENLVCCSFGDSNRVYGVRRELLDRAERLVESAFAPPPPPKTPEKKAANKPDK